MSICNSDDALASAPLEGGVGGGGGKGGAGACGGHKGWRSGWQRAVAFVLCRRQGYMVTLGHLRWVGGGGAGRGEVGQAGGSQPHLLASGAA